MEENSVNKCRVCLRKSQATFSLSKLVIGIKSKSTYGQLLQDCTNIEFSDNYEHLMPQNLCSFCCQELNRSSKFIQQARYCNNKLINLITKQLQKAVVMPENEELFSANTIQYETTENNLHNANNNEFRIVSTSVLLKPVELEEITEEYQPIELKENDENEVAYSSSFCKTSTDSTNTTETCPICEKTMNGCNNLIRHLRVQHDILAVGTNDNKWNALHREHSKTIVKPKPKERIFKCSSCYYVARTYSAISFHNRSKHGSEDDKFKCNFCDYTSWTKFVLFMHVKKSHRDHIKALKMDAENKMDLSEPRQNENENSSHTHRSSVTEIEANTSFEDTSNITIGRDEEESSDELFIRNILNVKKRRSQSISTNLLPRRCDECGNIYNNLQALKTHKRNVHVSKEQYISCPQCGKKFKKSKNMRVHLRSVHSNSNKIRKKPTKQTKEKCFMCSECSYVCSNKSQLTHHVNRHHTGEKPHKCDVCNKSFVVPFDLKIHSYLHTGERPYKCSICPKRFRCSADLVKHKRVHNKERPYKCKDCDKTFTQSYNLTLHKRTHLKEKNFKCMVCNKFFENELLLNTHRIKENHYDEIN